MYAFIIATRQSCNILNMARANENSTYFHDHVREEQIQNLQRQKTVR